MQTGKMIEMCIAQYSDMASAYRHTRREDMRPSEIDTGRPPYVVKREQADGTISYDTRIYVADIARIRRLAGENNPYAIDFLRERMMG